MSASAPAPGRRLLLPGTLWLAVFTFLPLVLVLAISLAGRGRPVDWSLDGSAWARLFDPRWLAVLLRSLVMASLTTAICLAVGVPLAWFVARRGERLRRVLYFLVLVPLWANTLALTYAWIVVLRSGGLLDRAARSLGLLGADEGTGLLYTPGAVLLGLVYAYLPYMVYAVYQSAERFDLRLLEAAEDLGATRLQAMRRVLLPGLRPGIVAGCVLVFVPALGAFVVPDLLGGSRQSYVGNAVRDAFLLDPTDWPLGCAMAVALIATTAFSAWTWFRFAQDAADGTAGAAGAKG
jgi:spermidine/putrescine transport system permease protein